MGIQNFGWILRQYLYLVHVFSMPTYVILFTSSEYFPFPKIASFFLLLLSFTLCISVVCLVRIWYLSSQNRLEDFRWPFRVAKELIDEGMIFSTKHWFGKNEVIWGGGGFLTGMIFGIDLIDVLNLTEKSYVLLFPFVFGFFGIFYGKSAFKSYMKWLDNNINLKIEV